jgi:hypothetical protein
MILLSETLSDYDRAYKGAARAGSPLLTVVDDFRVFQGAKTRDAVPLYSIRGNKLFKGLAVSGMPLATLVGDLIFQGAQVSGAPIARLKGDIALRGISFSGAAIVTVPSRNVNTLFAAAYHALRG